MIRYEKRWDLAYANVMGGMEVWKRGEKVLGMRCVALGDGYAPEKAWKNGEKGVCVVI